jgi:hypothetical protein
MIFGSLLWATGWLLAGGGCTFDTSGLNGEPLQDGALFDGALSDGTSHDSPAKPPLDGTTTDAIEIDAPTITDGDGDGIADHEDNCPHTANNSQINSDGDQWGDACDNCPQISNPDQADFDDDDKGNVCDDDIDGDAIPNEHDPHPENADTVYYYDDLDDALGDFETQGGTWHTDSSAICQGNQNASHTFTRLLSTTFSAAGYIVETQFHINQTGGIGDWPAVGLNAHSNASAPLYGWMCTVDPQNDRLVIIFYSNGSYENAIAGSTNMLIDTADHHLRAKVQTDTLTCHHVGSGEEISTPIDFSSNATVGFYSYKTDVCFHYLLVTALPP